MPFTEEEINELDRMIKEKLVADVHLNGNLKKLLDYYLDSQKNGVQAIRDTLNKELIDLNKELTSKEAIYDIVLEKIEAISKTLKKLPKEKQQEEKSAAPEKEDHKKPVSFLEEKANSKRDS